MRVNINRAHTAGIIFRHNRQSPEWFFRFISLLRSAPGIQQKHAIYGK
jgi:hypothetical protein